MRDIKLTTCAIPISIMIISLLFSYMIIGLSPGMEWIMAVQFFAILLIGLVAVYKKRKGKISTPFLVYLVGFSLFIGGRFIGALLGGSFTDSVFTFDFGYCYHLSQNDQLKLFIIVCLSLIATFWGYLSAGRKDTKFPYTSQRQKLSRNIRFFEVLTVILGVLYLWQTISSIQRVSALGYMTLYLDVTTYQARSELLVRALFESMVAITYGLHRQTGKLSKLTYAIFLLFILSNLLSILTGARGRFITVVLVTLMVLYRNRRFTPKTVVFICLGAFGLVTLTNYLTSITRFSTVGSSPLDGLVATLNGQGFTLMLFDLSTKVKPLDYPINAIIRLFIPGWQIVASFFDSSLKQEDLYLSQFLMNKFSPNEYAMGYGFGWSVLSDFYVIALGSKVVFLLLNFGLGRFLFRIEDGASKSLFGEGLFVVVSLSLFTLSRSSYTEMVMSMLVYCAVYLFFRLLTKRRSYESIARY